MMPSSTLVPHINITFAGTHDEDSVNVLLEYLFPGIIHQPFSIEEITGGLSNQLILVRSTKQNPVFPSILIRVYSHTTNCLVDRNLELFCLSNMFKFRGIPIIYATFNNGISYSYVTGFTIPLAYLSIEKYARMVASELAHFHSLPIKDVIPQPTQRNGLYCVESALFRRLRNWISKLPTELPEKEMMEKYKRNYPSVSALNSAVDELERYLRFSHSPVVLCHNDLLPGNIIVSPDESSVTFIDLEYCAFAPAAYDIGNHFCEFAGMEPTNYSKYPPLHFQRLWIRWYLEAYIDLFPMYHPLRKTFDTDADRLNSNSDSSHNLVSESLIDEWLIEVNYFALVSHLTWSVWAAIRAADNDHRFDFLSYAIVRFNEYCRFKGILAATFADGCVPTDFINQS